MVVGTIATLFGGLCLALGASALFIFKPATDGLQTARRARTRMIRRGVPIE